MREKEFCASIVFTKTLTITSAPPAANKAAHKMKEEGVEDPVRWTFDELKTRFPAMVKQAGYRGNRREDRPASDKINFTQLEREIIAKY